MWREGASSYVIESMDKSAIPYMPVPCQYNVATVSWNALT